MFRIASITIIFFVFLMQAAFGKQFDLPEPGDHMVGNVITDTIPEGNVKPLEFYAAKFNVGLSNLLESNPGLDPFLPAGGHKLIIPQKIILPQTLHEGIIINNAEMRLYYYPKNAGAVIVLPVGIGMVDGKTPENWVTHVERKKEGPSWTPTQHERQDYLKDGINLPSVVPAGPDNPMGNYALYLGKQYAIHGTNANFGIGLRVSHGCIRLRNNDIKYLFENVPTGTRVQFINEPIKIASEKDGSIWVEVHEPLSTSETDSNSDQKNTLPISVKLLEMIQKGLVDVKKVDRAMEERTGIPVRIDLDQKRI